MKRTRAEDEDKAQAAARFRPCCNLCCEVLSDPKGVMSSCRHFVCYRCCEKGAGRGACKVCGAACRYVGLKELPQEVRGVLVADASRLVVAAAQAVQWQFSQSVLTLDIGRKKIAALKHQKQTLDARIAQLTAAITKLRTPTDWLPPPSASSQLFIDHQLAPPTPFNDFQSVSSLRLPAAPDFTTPQNTTRRLFTDPRPGTTETSFTNIMANIGL